MITLIKYSLLAKLREKKWVLFNALFPIFLMLLIGTMVKNTMSTDLDLSKTTVYYYNGGGNKAVEEVLDYTKSSLKDGIFDFREIGSVEEGQNKVQLDASIFLNVDNNNIEVFSSDKNTSQAAVLTTTLKSVDSSVIVVKEMFRVNPEEAMKATSSYNEELNIEVEYLTKKSAPNSYDYYGIVEITMMVLYIMIFALGELEGERRNSTRERMCLANKSRFQYYSSKVISSFILSTIILIPGFLFSVFILKANWGANPLVGLMYIFTFSFMTCTIGTMIGIIMKDFEKSMALIQGLIIPVITFLGGSYLAFGDDIQGVFQYITYISPLRWLNRGLFKMIYAGDFAPLNTAVLLNGIIVIIGFLVIYRISRKEEIA